MNDVQEEEVKQQTLAKRREAKNDDFRCVQA